MVAKRIELYVDPAQKRDAIIRFMNEKGIRIGVSETAKFVRGTPSGAELDAWLDQKINQAVYMQQAQTMQAHEMPAGYIDESTIRGTPEFANFVEEHLNNEDFEVRPSEFGLGLFAKRAVRAGTEIPYHGLEVEEGRGSLLQKGRYTKLLRSPRPGFSTVGDVYPRATPNIASYANDAGHFEKIDTPKADRKKRGKFTKQYRRNKARENAALEHDGHNSFLRITRDLNARDEVLTGYGADYWDD